jgi:hypothetical protein
MRRCCVDSRGSGEERVAGFCEHGNEPSDYIKAGKFTIS